MKKLLIVLILLSLFNLILNIRIMINSGIALDERMSFEKFDNNLNPFNFWILMLISFLILIFSIVISIKYNKS